MTASSPQFRPEIDYTNQTFLVRVEIAGKITEYKADIVGFGELTPEKVEAIANFTQATLNACAANSTIASKQPIFEQIKEEGVLYHTPTQPTGSEKIDYKEIESAFIPELTKYDSTLASTLSDTQGKIKKVWESFTPRPAPPTPTSVTTPTPPQPPTAPTARKPSDIPALYEQAVTAETTHEEKAKSLENLFDPLTRRFRDFVKNQSDTERDALDTEREALKKELTDLQNLYDIYLKEQGKEKNPVVHNQCEALTFALNLLHEEMTEVPVPALDDALGPFQALIASPEELRTFSSSFTELQQAIQSSIGSKDREQKVITALHKFQGFRSINQELHDFFSTRVRILNLEMSENLSKTQYAQLFALNANLHKELREWNLQTTPLTPFRSASDGVKWVIETARKVSGQEAFEVPLEFSEIAPSLEKLWHDMQNCLMKRGTTREWTVDKTIQEIKKLSKECIASLHIKSAPLRNAIKERIEEYKLALINQISPEEEITTWLEKTKTQLQQESKKLLEQYTSFQPMTTEQKRNLIPLLATLIASIDEYQRSHLRAYSCVDDDIAKLRHAAYLAGCRMENTTVLFTSWSHAMDALAALDPESTNPKLRALQALRVEIEELEQSANPDYEKLIEKKKQFQKDIKKLGIEVSPYAFSSPRNLCNPDTAFVLELFQYIFEKSPEIMDTRSIIEYAENVLEYRREHPDASPDRLSRKLKRMIYRKFEEMTAYDLKPNRDIEMLVRDFLEITSFAARPPSSFLPKATLLEQKTSLDELYDQAMENYRKFVSLLPKETSNPLTIKTKEKWIQFLETLKSNYIKCSDLLAQQGSQGSKEEKSNADDRILALEMASIRLQYYPTKPSFDPIETPNALIQFLAPPLEAQQWEKAYQTHLEAVLLPSYDDSRGKKIAAANKQIQSLAKQNPQLGELLTTLTKIAELERLEEVMANREPELFEAMYQPIDNTYFEREFRTLVEEKLKLLSLLRGLNLYSKPFEPVVPCSPQLGFMLKSLQNINENGLVAQEKQILEKTLLKLAPKINEICSNAIKNSESQSATKQALRSAVDKEKLAVELKNVLVSALEGALDKLSPSK